MTTIVLLPGMDGTGTLYAPLHKALNDRCKLLVVTYPVDQVLDYAALEAVARSYLPVDEEYILLGESFSGPIAVSIAASQPPGLRALILCASFARNPHALFSGLRYFLPCLPVQMAPSALLSHLLLGKFSTTELRQLLVHAIMAVSPAVLRARMRSVLLVDVRQKLSAIKVPVLYLHATQDRLVPVSAYKEIEKILPSVKLYEFDAPHFLLQTKAKEIADLISGV
ncbi:alpha/beta hydrolase [Undibacterium sp. CY18W]|uniref:Alpha/beta hydrolase n=1 Tax=Undibacterium hunanense TaxID=2762292 RepID=A0ABR6ZN09_9BURK|nr:alpha/beta hydrolase [Undibacterium hunanense]MBC3917247.1 alpha/beta hydrolase [Undibacterium hunanense]